MRSKRLKCETVLVITVVVTLAILPRRVHMQEYELKGPKFPLIKFTTLDSLNIPQAFNNKHYLKFLLKCVFFEGYCDIVGKWLKPRAMAALFGKCLACTDFQDKNMGSWMEILVDKHPLEFRAAMVKVLVDMEIPVAQEELKLLRPYSKISSFDLNL